MDTKQKLVELLSENFCEYCNVDIIAGNCKIRAITFDVDRFADFLISNGVTFQAWVPVNERLPEHCVTVLSYDGRHYRTVKTDSYDEVFEKWLSDMDDILGSDTVTHWMPLPEPPKEV